MGIPDGAYPYAGVAMDKAGNLFGTTQFGGSGDSNGYGTVFKLHTAGNETVLHRFTFGPDGEYPSSRLIMDEAGNLYGTTIGTIFKLNTSRSSITRNPPIAASC
jgi:uncharacterized repeat protein (TIGR03803 family)